jgi:hypothetical protein
MSKGFLIVLVVLASVGFYLYKTNWFTDINVKFDYSPEGVSVLAKGMDYHDCELKLTNDYAVKIPLIRQNQYLSIGKNEFRQWNGTDLESIKDLGEKIEFKMRCREGKIETTDSNRYNTSAPAEGKASDSGEVVDSN